MRSEIALKLLMLVLLAVPASMLNEVQAQTEPEAFFIYRNDGDFDGFFYDRVLRMNFSKIGIDSVEYDYYVVQEIETPDSIYRIPLAAIDSIGFQQPEIRFSPKLKNMDELGITPYVTEAGTRLGISKSIPSDLLPKVGDVVAGFNSDIYPQEMASGWDENNIHNYVVKIASTSEPLPWYHEDDNSYYFVVESIDDLSDVFDQYITVEDIVEPLNDTKPIETTPINTVNPTETEGEVKLEIAQTQKEETVIVPKEPEHHTIDTPFDPHYELRDFKFPTLDMLNDYGGGKSEIDEEELNANKNKIRVTA